MNCYEIRFDDELDTEVRWLDEVQSSLFRRWVSETGHSKDASHGTWACEIANGCRTCNKHLSVSCSLLAEANEIGSYLEGSCFSDEPATFFRMMLITLSEFTGQLHKLAGMMDLPVGTPPSILKVWANRWAKHRLSILVLHHPYMAFADRYGGDEEALRQRLLAEPYILVGRPTPFTIIDTSWLRVHSSPDMAHANAGRQAVILVPSFVTFVDATCSYFRRFVDACLKQPDAVRMFQAAG